MAVDLSLFMEGTSMWLSSYCGWWILLGVAQFVCMCAPWNEAPLLCHHALPSASVVSLGVSEQALNC